MDVRRTLSTIAVGLTVLGPSTALAQSAWVPPRGDVALSARYQWLDAARHVFSNLTGPDLTPLEVAIGTDFTSNSVDRGRVQSHGLAVDADIGLTERLGLSGSLAFIASRYLGTFPEQPLVDNGLFQPSIQDFYVGARYMLGTDVWRVTPFTTVISPARHYDVLAHAAQGLGLTMLEVGASVGRILLVDGAAKGYVQGTYGYAFTERPILDVPMNRSRATLEAGYFLGRLSVQALTVWRRVHGGLEWSDLGVGSEDHFAGHDQAAATREWRYGAGVSFQLTDAASVEITYGDFIRGANTHAARAITLGWSWAFHAFGDPGLGGAFK
jgi:hypothetical protein